jgi:hypothetical protein
MHTSFRVTGVLPDLVLSVARDGNVQIGFIQTYRGARHGSVDRDNGRQAVSRKGIPLQAHESN